MNFPTKVALMYLRDACYVNNKLFQNFGRLINLNNDDFQEYNFVTENINSWIILKHVYQCEKCTNNNKEIDLILEKDNIFLMLNYYQKIFFKVKIKIIKTD